LDPESATGLGKTALVQNQGVGGVVQVQGGLGSTESTAIDPENPPEAQVQMPAAAEGLQTTQFGILAILRTHVSPGGTALQPEGKG
jgi:hypothetical protein